MEHFDPPTGHLGGVIWGGGEGTLVCFPISAPHLPSEKVAEQNYFLSLFDIHFFHRTECPYPLQGNHPFKEPWGQTKVAMKIHCFMFQ